MANSLDGKRKFALTKHLEDVITSEKQLTIVQYIESAARKLGFDVTEGNVVSACRTLDTTPAKVFAKPADLVPALQARIKDLEQQVALLEAEKEGFGKDEKKK